VDQRDAGREPLKTLTDLEQVRVLADPLRLRMLGAFMEERTTKQVADMLGEKPTRLYHHVDALEQAGLIRLRRTARKRGTTEKYYQSVAERFRADVGMFMPGEGDPNPLFDLVDQTLDRTRLELRELLSARGGAVLEDEGLHSFIEIGATPARLERLRKELLSLIEGLREDDEPNAEALEDAAEQRRYRLMIALFPLPGESKE
jgi:DNA-binding transcriptional ArsR family regulator